MTEETAHIASRDSDGKSARAGKDIEERLLFYGIDMDGYGITVAKRIQETVTIDADGTIPSLPGSQNASAGT